MNSWDPWLYWCSGFFVGYAVGMFLHSWLRLRAVRRDLAALDRESLH